MSSTAIEHQRLIVWGVASRPLAGQPVSGDLHLVKFFDQGVLLAVMDGIGHGAEATFAAEKAAEVLNGHAPESVISLFRRCHAALSQTRGVVLTLASLNTLDATLNWLGVGNVEGRLLRADTRASPPKESAPLRGGVVGYQLPALPVSTVTLEAGDIVVFATDGVRPGFTEELNLDETPQQMADQILHRHGKGTDDALVLVVRYLGTAHEQ